ncbi:NAD+ synthase [Teredinibacter turnerae T7901]|uniref:NAD+ synthase n=2 Tax=Teredinibacter turnerae TaxID=2426 RepID=C5BNJ1_TERTT|nr:NAD+ synthase [Teredinibacter turnerae T7901]
MKKIIGSLYVSAALLVSQGAAAMSIPLAEYNLVVAGDYVHEGGSVWGKTFIGGDLNGGASEFAVQVPAAPVVDSLQVVGDINAGHVKVKSGNLVLGGAISSSSNVELHGAGASIVHDAGLSIDSVVADLKSASQTFSGMSGVGNSASFVNGAFSYSGTSSVAFFDMSYDELFRQNTNFTFSGVQADTLIINVSGTHVNTGYGYNFPGLDLSGNSGLGASDILWNFFEAEELTISNPIVGSILAIDADVTLMGTLDGSLAAGSLRTQRQIHDYEYPHDVSTVPLPGSSVLFGSALLAFAAARYRRKKRA